VSYSYARINLEKTDYNIFINTKAGMVLGDLIPWPVPSQLNEIYYKYCNHHKFNSVMPIFDIEYEDNDIHGYYQQGKLIAFSMIGIYDDENIECYQFAWDYETPKLQLGIASLKHECAYYKAKGFKYLYVGGADAYKNQIDGLEIMSPVNWIDDRWTIDGFERIQSK
jgi:arginyl-tRNA--protein-N-Asp/Glu arginylyltransferase